MRKTNDAISGFIKEFIMDHTAAACAPYGGASALSILDFCQTGPAGDAAAGLADTIKTAIMADRLGYRRYWLAEHWDAGVSTSSPELLTPIIASMTDRIRVGPAGVLLAFYSPLKVACNALLAECLFPNRIDLGLARGGAAPQVVGALLGKAGDQDWMDCYPEKVAEVLACLEQRGAVPVHPGTAAVPEVWVLGSGKASAPLAAGLGTCLALSLLHGNSTAAPEIIEEYRAAFRVFPNQRSRPQACIAVAGVCADTEAAALRIAAAHNNPFVKINIIGTPERWRDELGELCRRFGVDEVVILQLCPRIEDRKRSLELLAEAFALDSLKNRGT